MKNKDNPGSKYRRPKEKGTKEHQGHIMCFPHTWQKQNSTASKKAVNKYNSELQLNTKTPSVLNPAP